MLDYSWKVVARIANTGQFEDKIKKNKFYRSRSLRGDRRQQSLMLLRSIYADTGYQGIAKISKMAGEATKSM